MEWSQTKQDWSDGGQGGWEVRGGGLVLPLNREMGRRGEGRLSLLETLPATGMVYGYN